MREDDVGGSVSRRGPITRALPQAPIERQGSIAILTPAKRSALIACFRAGELHKENGAWHGPSTGAPLSGITIANLARDGLLTVTTNRRLRSAHLTVHGNKVALTLLDDGAIAK